MGTAVRSAVRNEARLSFQSAAAQFGGVAERWNCQHELLGLSLNRVALHHHKKNNRFGRTIEFAYQFSRQFGGFRVPPRFD